jgi:hypothetical protein
MGYGFESKQPLFTKPCYRDGSFANDSIYTFTKNNTVVMQVLQPCTAFGVGVFLLANNLATNNMTMAVSRNVKYNNTVGNNVIANFTVGPYANTAIGQIWYCGSGSNNFAPLDLNAGDELVYAAGDGGGSVQWYPWIDAAPRAETKVNNNDFVKCANT